MWRFCTVQTIYAGGFEYDATINEHATSNLSPSLSQRVWPYTMDFGIPQVRLAVELSLAELSPTGFEAM